jgi:LacI family transcriptional regulator
MAAAYLADLGHRKMLYFNPRKASNPRLEGFQRELRKRKLPQAVECLEEKELSLILKSPERPSAVFAYCDFDAMKVKTAAMDLKLKVPEDISIVGFNDEVYASFPELCISTLKPQKQEIGAKAMNILIKMIKGEKVEMEYLLKPELVARKSSGKAKG